MHILAAQFCVKLKRCSCILWEAWLLHMRLLTLCILRVIFTIGAGFINISREMMQRYEVNGMQLYPLKLPFGVGF